MPTGGMTAICPLQPIPHGQLSPLKHIRRSDIHVGKPLPWSIYDRGGRLLLRKGALIAYEAQIDRLAQTGLFIQEDDAADGTSSVTDVAAADNNFDWLLAAAWSMKPMLNEIVTSDEVCDVIPRFRMRAERIAKASRHASDACLASVHLDFRNPYRLAHPIHAAVLGTLIARRLGLGERECIAIACAALTCDLGMLDLNYLEKQSGSLDEDQTAAVHGHPARSAAILERAGVVDDLWLDIVRTHHERWNGTGYPSGTARETIPVGARILAVADSYAAMIKNRSHRPALAPFAALSQLFRGMGTLYDPEVCSALVKEIGMYPPGSFVRLANAETAVVKSRSSETEWPVFAVYGPDDLPYLSPRQRDAATGTFGVVAARAQTECLGSESIVRRLWAQ